MNAVTYIALSLLLMLLLTLGGSLIGGAVRERERR